MAQEIAEASRGGLETQQEAMAEEIRLMELEGEDAQEHAKTILEKQAVLRAQVKELKEALEEAMQTKQAFLDRIEKAQQDREDAMRRAGEAHGERDAAEDERKTESSILEASIAALTHRKEELQHDLVELKEQEKASHEAKEQSEKRAAALREKLDDLRNKMSAIRSRVARLETEAQHQGDLTTEVQQHESQLQEQLSTAEQEKQLAEEEATRVAGNLQSSKERQQRAEEALEETKHRVEQIRATMEETQKKLQEASEEARAASEQAGDAVHLRRQWQQNATALAYSIEELQEDLQLMRTQSDTFASAQGAAADPASRTAHDEEMASAIEEQQRQLRRLKREHSVRSAENVLSALEGDCDGVDCADHSNHDSEALETAAAEGTSDSPRFAEVHAGTLSRVSTNARAQADAMWWWYLGHCSDYNHVVHHYYVRTSQLNALRVENHHLRNRVDDANRRLAAARSELAEKTGRANKAEEALQTTRNNLASAKANVTKLLQDVRAAQAKLEKSMDTMDEKYHKALDLEFAKEDEQVALKSARSLLQRLRDVVHAAEQSAAEADVHAAEMASAARTAQTRAKAAITALTAEEQKAHSLVDHAHSTVNHESAAAQAALTAAEQAGMATEDLADTVSRATTELQDLHDSTKRLLQEIEDHEKAQKEAKQSSAHVKEVLAQTTQAKREAEDTKSKGRLELDRIRGEVASTSVARAQKESTLQTEDMALQRLQDQLSAQRKRATGAGQTAQEARAAVKALEASMQEKLKEKAELEGKLHNAEQSMRDTKLAGARPWDRSERVHKAQMKRDHLRGEVGLAPMTDMERLDYIRAEREKAEQ